MSTDVLTASMSDRALSDSSVAEARRLELASFLRTRRSELQPEDVALRRIGRRRVAGLRRHEVADLAGVSITWYTWLEQARDIRLSPQVIDALSRALRLDDDGWRYIRRLALCPVVEPQEPPVEANPYIVGMLESLLPNPAFVITGPFDLLAWNKAYAVVFADPADLPPVRRNAIWTTCLNKVRDRTENWDLEMDDIVYRLRAEAAKYPGDPRFREVINDLLQTHPEFRRAWERHQVRRFVGRAQTIHIPNVGTIRMNLLQFRPVDQPATVLMVHQAADHVSAMRLADLVDG
jgi:transcriptional regulator with XRE-family HTH domain